MSERGDYFVYVLEDNGEPFYVGCSFRPRRPYEHVIAARRGPQWAVSLPFGELLRRLALSSPMVLSRA